MTQQIIMDYAMHFVNLLPSDQGKDNNPVILLVDGHSTRLDAILLLYFMQNNAFLFILALHISIWSQPNINGPNSRIHNSLKLQ